MMDLLIGRSLINSITIDIYGVMKSVWQIFPGKPELEHVLMIPRDSHAPQPVIKDIIDPKTLKISRAKEVFKSTLDIVVFFHHSPLEYVRMQPKWAEK